MNSNDLIEDETGYSTRLITYEDLTNNLGAERQDEDGDGFMKLKTEKTPSWVYSENYWYWTMSPYEDSNYKVWQVGSDGWVHSNSVGGSNGGIYDGESGTVRPVITLKKSAI